jgi:hypothetical protein
MISFHYRGHLTAEPMQCDDDQSAAGYYYYYYSQQAGQGNE